jgi:hypothetical protein
VGAPVAEAPLEGVLEQLELGVAADERRIRGPSGRPVPRADRLPRPHRPREPAEVERADVLGVDRAERQPVGRRSDQHLPRLGRLLQPRGDVDGFAGGEGRVRVVGDDLPGLDAGAGVESEIGEGFHDRERRANRALRVVLVRDGDAERGHHGVARVLLDGAAVEANASRDALEELRYAPAGDLGIRARDERRRVDDVDKEDGRELSLHV